jgi:hypothetical protein
LSAVLTEALRRQRQAEARMRLLAELGTADLTEAELALQPDKHVAVALLQTVSLIGAQWFGNKLGRVPIASAVGHRGRTAPTPARRWT